MPRVVLNTPLPQMHRRVLLIRPLRRIAAFPASALQRDFSELAERSLVLPATTFTLMQKFGPATSLVSPAQIGTSYSAGVRNLCLESRSEERIGDAIGCSDWTFTVNSGSGW